MSVDTVLDRSGNVRDTEKTALPQRFEMVDLGIKVPDFSDDQLNKINEYLSLKNLKAYAPSVPVSDEAALAYMFKKDPRIKLPNDLFKYMSEKVSLAEELYDPSDPKGAEFGKNFALEIPVWLNYLYSLAQVKLAFPERMSEIPVNWNLVQFGLDRIKNPKSRYDVGKEFLIGAGVIKMLFPNLLTDEIAEEAWNKRNLKSISSGLKIREEKFYDIGGIFPYVYYPFSELFYMNFMYRDKLSELEIDYEKINLEAQHDFNSASGINLSNIFIMEAIKNEPQFKTGILSPSSSVPEIERFEE